MTTTSTPDDHPSYWRALRFYTRSWREMHGADMVALMLDARDHGEDPLSGSGRAALMWSGLRQRFAARPWVVLWIVATLLSLGLHQWASRNNMQRAANPDHFDIKGFDPVALVLALGSAALFIACLTILTASLLHRPAFPVPVERFTGRSWPGWLAFFAGTGFIVGTPLILGSLVFGVRRYRAGGGMEFSLLATLSAVAIGMQVVVLTPVVHLLFFMG